MGPDFSVLLLLLQTVASLSRSAFAMILPAEVVRPTSVAAGTFARVTLFVLFTTLGLRVNVGAATATAFGSPFNASGLLTTVITGCL